MMSLLFCRFYVILKLSNRGQLFLLCPCINDPLSKAFAFLADIITGSADPYKGHILQPDIFKREDLQGPYMWFITGLQVSQVNCLFRIWCWKIYWRNSITACLVELRVEECRIYLPSFLWSLQHFLFLQISMHVLAFFLCPHALLG